MLITSAVGGEGKTTLAAQLAARCGNAGMSTLLIDADLRRTGLCSLLDVPEGPGLSDALESDEPVPTELVVPVQGGTFHLLPAGTPIPDTSRVLQDRKLGLIIAQFRQLYDLVIIDSPPVLPVPDALILGRWADGAVLAVRFDISRFPQVERARRQLDGAGIAVLGTVINGMKNSDSYYGRYSYSRQPVAPGRFARRALEFPMGRPCAARPAAGDRRSAPRRGAAGSNDVSDRAARARSGRGPDQPIRSTVILGRLHRRVQPTGTESAPRPADRQRPHPSREPDASR